MAAADNTRARGAGHLARTRSRRVERAMQLPTSMSWWIVLFAACSLGALVMVGYCVHLLVARPQLLPSPVSALESPPVAESPPAAESPPRAEPPPLPDAFSD